MPGTTVLLNLRGLWPQFSAMRSEQILRLTESGKFPATFGRKLSGGCSLRLLLRLLSTAQPLLSAASRRGPSPFLTKLTKRAKLHEISVKGAQ